MKQTGVCLDSNYLKRIMGGLAAAALSAILGGMLITTLVVSGSMTIDKMDITVTLVLFVSTFLAALYIKAWKGKGRSGAILILVSSIIAVVLLINVIAFSGEFHRLPLKMAAIFIGALIMLFINRDKPKKYRNVKNR